jgi:hypothetical protein
MNFFTAHRTLTGAILCTATTLYCQPHLLAAEPESEESSSSLRSYSEGVLRPDDYQAEVPDPLPRSGGRRMLSYTWTRVRYQCKYKYAQQRQAFVVTLTNFDPVAYIDREVSWNAVPTDKKLIEHEQGHFDIAHLSALQLRKEVEDLRQQGKPIKASGRSLREATLKLDSHLATLSYKYEKAAAEEHLRYDKMTSHGTIGSAQAHFREEQIQAIEELVSKFKAVDDFLLNN